MTAEPDGFFHQELSDIVEGQRYTYRLDGGERRADPCSLWQPDGFDGPSAVVFTQDFTWTDERWKGVSQRELVFYELHVGTFTRAGTFAAIIPRLRSLRELGITAIELMPVQQFPGDRNWGYDGIYPYATQNSYGGPRELAKLVDAAHAEGLAVFLDVVYNHFGPEGNYMGQFGRYLTDCYHTPWGQALNYDDADCEPVRDFIYDNARMWLSEFHLDGLRLDAVHSIFDFGARHILGELSELAEVQRAETGRLVHIVAESDLNDPRLLYQRQRGGLNLDAQWSDDFHHAVHVTLTGERRGYYRDFEGLEDVAKALRTPFVYAGQYSRSRRRRHGATPTGLSGDRFVVCIQNHDQIGNRALGDRLTTVLTEPAQRRLASSLLLLSPYLPLLFMGEEYGETRPFPFFCSFKSPELIKAVREGRRREFAHFVTDTDLVPDPDDRATFESAILEWKWPEGTEAAATRRLHADLLTARRHWRAMRDFEHRTAQVIEGTSVLELVRGSEEPIRALFNFGDRPVSIGIATAAPLRFSSEWPQYGGARTEAGPPEILLPWECIALG